MIPITSKNRILHMLDLLEQLFSNPKKSTKLSTNSDIKQTQDDRPVLYLEYMSKDTLDVAKSHLNWMNFQGRFRDIDDNPFAFKNIKPINSLKELQEELEMKRPRVIVTSSASMEMGFSRQFLREFTSKDTNMIIFTE